MTGRLAVAERTRLMVLVGRLRLGVIRPHEEQELRALIGREYPKEAVALDQERLGLLGLGMMGAWYLFREEPLAHA
jgi:hypothetical protein